MKEFLMVFLMVLSISGFSQSVSFELYGYNPCTQEIKRISLFGLVKEDTTFSVVDTTAILKLEERGVYSLSYVMDNIDTTELGKSYNIYKEGSYVDTLQLISIYPCLEPTSHPDFIGYCCCDTKCEGVQIDYYSNGTKRVEGYFKNGIPVGSVKFYYPNGKLKQNHKYSKSGRLMKRIFYNEKGNILKIESI